ncbi:MAG: hypothetical protein HZB42_12100 [Sphingobacteriales bacterium]|nr:hypothetical protein [Sphingobacteriales bacterium]
MYKKILLLFLLISGIELSGQTTTKDSAYQKYSYGLIYRMGGSIMKGKERITFQELGKEFSMSEIGLDQYKIAKRKLTIGKILLFTSFACGLIAGATGPNNMKLGFGFLGAQMVTLTMSMQSRGAGNRYLDQAIQIRNKDYLFPDSH